MPRFSFAALAACSLAALPLGAASTPAPVTAPATTPATAPATTAPPVVSHDEGPLPQLGEERAAEVTEIDVSGAARALFKVAVVAAQGTDDAMSADVMSRDFQLSSLVEVLDPRSFKGDVAGETTRIDDRSWREVGAEYVVKTQVEATRVTFRLFAVSRSRDAVLTKAYDVSKESMRSVTHQFCNEVIKWLTGTPGSFGGRLVFSSRTEKGKRGIFVIDADGSGLGRLPAPQDVAQAPAFGPGGVYYSGSQTNGSFAIFKVGVPAPVFEQTGLALGVAFFGKRLAAVVASGGRADVFKGELGAKEPQRVTQGGLSTHPAFSSDGRLAWASDVGGTQQIYVEGKRVTWRGKENMAPTWCGTPQGMRILFMGREGGVWDVFSIDPDGGSLQRLTQGQGSNKYPACSPDGRMIAFFSSRGGLFMANPQGLNQQIVAKVEGESLRWEP